MAWPVPTVAHPFIKDRRTAMPRGSKAAYSSKQRREARHIEESYEKRGVSSKEAARRAWATVNKQTGGAAGKKASAKKSYSSVRRRKCCFVSGTSASAGKCTGTGARK
jgi:hypothetical protein